MGLSATIDGVACHIRHGVHISRPETGPASLTECVLAFHDVADRPTKGQILKLFIDSNLEFAGFVNKPIIRGVDGAPTGAVEVEIVGEDFNGLATRRFLEPNWAVPAGTDVATIAAAIVGYLPGVELDPAQATGPNISVDMVAGKWRVVEALDFVTQDTGWRWRIYLDGDDLYLLFYDPTTENAPFNIDDGSEHLDGDMEVVLGSEDYANDVTVWGDGVVGHADDSGEIAAKGSYEFQATSQETDQAAVDGIAAVLLAVKLPLWEIIQLTYPTLSHGLRPGQTQDIVQTKRGINGTFIISQVDTVLHAYAEHTITAVEGIAWKPGWRQLTRELFGGGSPGAGSLPGVITGGGGGGLSFIRAWMWYGGNSQGVAAENDDDWIDVSDWHQQVDTATRGTLSVAMTARVRAFTAGVKVRLRLWNVDQGGPATGTSAQITTPSADANGVTPFTTVTWTVTADAGSDRYKLQAQPDTAGVPIAAFAAGI